MTTTNRKDKPTTPKENPDMTDTIPSDETLYEETETTSEKNWWLRAKMTRLQEKKNRLVTKAEEIRSRQVRRMHEWEEKKDRTPEERAAYLEKLRAENDEAITKIEDSITYDEKVILARNNLREAKEELRNTMKTTSGAATSASQWVHDSVVQPVREYVDHLLQRPVNENERVSSYQARQQTKRDNWLKANSARLARQNAKNRVKAAREDLRITKTMTPRFQRKHEDRAYAKAKARAAWRSAMVNSVMFVPRLLGRAIAVVLGAVGVVLLLAVVLIGLILDFVLEVVLDLWFTSVRHIKATVDCFRKVQVV